MSSHDRAFSYCHLITRNLYQVFRHFEEKTQYIVLSLPPFVFF